MSPSSLHMHVDMDLHRHERMHRHTYTPPSAEHLGTLYNELTPHKIPGYLRGRALVAGVPCNSRNSITGIFAPLHLQNTTHHPHDHRALEMPFCTK